MKKASFTRELESRIRTSGPTPALFATVPPLQRKKSWPVWNAANWFEREVWDRTAAIARRKEMGEAFKAELIEDLPESETITIYRQGEWFDLCRGPHLPSTGKIGKAFKLMKVAGAYWRGDHRNAQLQRIYGTAWLDDKQLKAHLEHVAPLLADQHRSPAEGPARPHEQAPRVLLPVHQPAVA